MIGRGRRLCRFDWDYIIPMFSALRVLASKRAQAGSLRAGTSARHSSRSVRSILEDDDTPVDLSEDNDAVDGRRPSIPRRKPSLAPTPATWQAHRQALKEEFPEGWNPPRKLSREAMDGLRQLHRVNPETFSTPVLAERFKISPEAVRRILKSRWTPPADRRTKLLKREAKAREAYLSLSALRERMETRRVLESKSDMRAAKTMDWGQEDEDGDGGVAEPGRGIHSRDRLAFE
ncbi:hypothetical protein C8R44DRAFT_119314 [Mycena epipterygia]|nr:hypothetical protein C8R44DRAFT_119314 [Mycena epipterygia]